MKSIRILLIAIFFIFVIKIEAQVKQKTSKIPQAKITNTNNLQIKKIDSVIDTRNGISYKTVIIGTQTWMAENLNTKMYQNGDTISFIQNNNEWSNLTYGGYCNYHNDTNNAITYGRLYNWYAIVDKRNICPIGWHVPTDSEWNKLIIYLGGYKIAGNKLKEKGTLNWGNQNKLANNFSGFTALPGGHIYPNGIVYLPDGTSDTYNGDFDGIGNDGCWWSSTEIQGECAISYNLNHYDSGVIKEMPSKKFGLSIRCIKD